MVLVDFKGGATFAGMARAAARLGGHHQPGAGADPGRPHAGRPVRRDGASPGAAARGRQLRLDPRLREGPGRRRAARARCRRCSWSSTSSPRCCRPSRSSSTCSSRSAGSAGRWACTCCSPPSGWRRGACAAWSPTCPTGSGCAPSAPRSPGRCSASPTPTSCRRCPAWATSSPSRRRCSGSRRRTSPGRRPRAGRAYAATRAGTCRASCRSPSPRCRPSTRSTTSPRWRSGPSSEGEEKSLLDVAVEHMVGEGPPAHQVWLPPLDVPDTLDQLMGDLTEDPELGLVSPHWRRLGGLVVPLGTVDRPREQRRDTARPSTSPAPAGTSRWSAVRAAARAPCCAPS